MGGERQPGKESERGERSGMTEPRRKRGNRGRRERKGEEGREDEGEERGEGWGRREVGRARRGGGMGKVWPNPYGK